MKSKSFTLSSNSPDKSKKKAYDFIGLYRSTAETNDALLLLETNKAVEENHAETDKKSNTSETVKRVVNKKKNRNELQNIQVPEKTSTPKASRNKQDDKVKSIMKNTSVTCSDEMDTEIPDISPNKSKKRNKSVSFMLDDNEEVVIKKSKSSEALVLNKGLKKAQVKAETNYELNKKRNGKYKKAKQAEKENKHNVNNISMDTEDSITSESPIKKQKSKTLSENTESTDYKHNTKPIKKKKIKRNKKAKVEENSEPTEDSNNNEDEIAVEKAKKIKKKKRQAKQQSTDTTETEGEPIKKARKTDANIKAEAITENLENLSIGDNAHTLTNLLDEMSVAEKTKRKKNRDKLKKDASKSKASSSEAVESEKTEDEKEKVKWKRRRWNKDKKGDFEEEDTSIIVGNLSLSIMFTYRKLLTEHFIKYGLIKKIGIAEVYPTDDPKPVFATTIVFYSDGAAEQALQEDNTLFEGNRIRLKRPLPPTETKIVVRSYADLTDQSLSSVFSSVGRVRSIRILVKGRKAIATAFVEFDGPEAVSRALNIGSEQKIGGKKIYVSKFEKRNSRVGTERNIKNTESENEGDSEYSND